MSCTPNIAQSHSFGDNLSDLNIEILISLMLKTAGQCACHDHRLMATMQAIMSPSKGKHKLNSRTNRLLDQGTTDRPTTSSTHNKWICSASANTRKNGKQFFVGVNSITKNHLHMLLHALVCAVPVWSWPKCVLKNASLPFELL